MEIHPLTPERWSDFEELFGPRGAYGGCWCMWWRTTRKEFEGCQGEKNRQAMKALVEGMIRGAVDFVRKKGGKVIDGHERTLLVPRTFEYVETDFLSSLPENGMLPVRNVRERPPVSPVGR